MSERLNATGSGPVGMPTDTDIPRRNASPATGAASVNVASTSTPIRPPSRPRSSHDGLGPSVGRESVPRATWAMGTWSRVVTLGETRLRGSAPLPVLCSTPTPTRTVPAEADPVGSSTAYTVTAGSSFANSGTQRALSSS